MGEKYGLVVIGAGPGGYEAALEAAKSGVKTAVVEMNKVGGTCLNRGCIPTKTFMHTVNVLEEMRNCGAIGLSADGITFDMNAIYDRKEEVTGKLGDGITGLFKKSKVDYFEGAGKVLAKGLVSVTPSDESLEPFELQCDNIMIAAGSVPSKPDIPGIDLPGVITSDDIFDGRVKAFESLVIVGGGVIGIELATIFSAFGTKITMIEYMDKLASVMDKEISQSLALSLKKKGVDINTGAALKKIEQAGDGSGKLICTYEMKDGEKTVVSEAVLVSVGRKANLDYVLGEGIDLAVDNGKIPVDENMETKVSGIYAVGDVVKGSTMLAHVASTQGKNAARIIAGKEPLIDLALVPTCLYTNPEVACIGLTADEAKTLGIPAKTGKALTTSNGKTIIEQGDRGFIKIVAEKDTNKILGVQMMCARATDMIGEFALAIENELTLDDMQRVMRAHPTYNEVIGEAVEATLAK